MEKNNDRKLPLKSLQPKITARSSKPLAFCATGSRLYVMSNRGMAFSTYK